VIVEKLDDASKQVLRVLSGGDVLSGSRLLYATSMDEKVLIGAIETLIKNGLVSYKGDLSPNGFLDTWFTLLPSARSLTSLYLSM